MHFSQCNPMPSDGLAHGCSNGQGSFTIVFGAVGECGTDTWRHCSAQASLRRVQNLKASNRSLGSGPVSVIVLGAAVDHPETPRCLVSGCPRSPGSVPDRETVEINFNGVPLSPLIASPIDRSS